MEFRHELKFLVSDAQLAQIQYRIAPLMQKDKNQKSDYYTITSLYFDDIYDRCLQENLSGDDLRHKYRIRIYDHSFDCIKLEKKSKIHGMTKKDSVTLSREECNVLVSGKNPCFQPSLSPRKQALFCEMQLLGLQPKSIVEYDRTAFVNRIGNVRVTFDRNIRGSLKPSDFFLEKINMVPLTNAGTHVLEVKYDEFLPSYLYDALELGTLYQTAFSKYGYSRKI